MEKNLELTIMCLNTFKYMIQEKMMEPGSKKLTLNAQNVEELIRKNTEPEKTSVGFDYNDETGEEEEIFIFPMLTTEGGYFFGQLLEHSLNLIDYEYIVNRLSIDWVWKDEIKEGNGRAT